MWNGGRSGDGNGEWIAEAVGVDGAPTAIIWFLFQVEMVGSRRCSDATFGKSKILGAIGSQAKVLDLYIAQGCSAIQVVDGAGNFPLKGGGPQVAECDAHRNCLTLTHGVGARTHLSIEAQVGHRCPETTVGTTKAAGIGTCSIAGRLDKIVINDSRGCGKVVELH